MGAAPGPPLPPGRPPHPAASVSRPSDTAPPEFTLSSEGTLRRRLLGLLATFALFAVAAAGVTIYGTQWYMSRAVEDFEQAIGHSSRADRLELSLRQQALLLRALATGQNSAARPYVAARDEFQTLLRQMAVFSADGSLDSPWTRLSGVAERFAEESDRCLDAIQRGGLEEAQSILANPLEATLLPELETRLVQVRDELDDRFNQSSRELALGSGRVLAVTTAVAGLAAGLVVVGGVLIHRWLMRPIAELKRATEGFARGHLEERVRLPEGDELGALGRSMNQMAESLARAEADLRNSENKHRLLFQNLRDAVVLVDENTAILEYHDSDTGLLGVEGSEHVGRRLLDVWPAWRSAGCAWDVVLPAAIREGRRYRAIDLELPAAVPNRPLSFVDILVFRVEFGAARCAAIVLRDVTERSFLQRRLRQAETMEAVGTLAGGLAHDFNNLLAGVIGNLSMLEGELTNERQAGRVRAAIQTCWQASGLSRRLLNFAGSAHGQPQVFCVCDALRTILAALDPSFLEGVELHAELDQAAMVRMDRDQFTQSILNLVRNAREAMAGGGRLSIAVERVHALHPEGGQSEEPFALIAVSDTGAGMTREVKARIFEPFFTTKSRASHRGRGMGLAVVYAAVRNAGGFIRVDSEPGRGTTFRVHLPICESLSAAAEAQGSAGGDGVILVLQPDIVLQGVMAEALRQRGYTTITASDEQEAKWLCEAHPDVRLMVADAAHGDTAWTRVLGEGPRGGEGLCAILVGGDPQEWASSSWGRQVVGRIEKPFEIETLLAAVDQAWRPLAAPDA